jgi:hypothetical protein
MTTTVKNFNSTMTGAPVLTGQAGAMKTLLKTCLVDGFASASVQALNVASNVATATFAAPHAYTVGSIVLIAGATPAALNGEKLVTATTATTISYAATGVPDGAATGTITAKLAPAGWQELYTGTNLSAFKPTVPEATGCILRVDDTGTKNGRVRLYETMSDINTGTGPTPTDTQVSGGLYWPKSATTDATARSWYFVGDTRGFYLAVAPNGSSRFTILYAGDIASLKSGDAYACVITGNEADQTALASGAPNGCVGYSGRSARVGCYMVRDHLGVGQSVSAQRLGAHHNGSTADAYAGTAGYSLGTYPNGANNGLLTGSLELFSTAIRGGFPGLLHPVQDMTSANLAAGQTVLGTDDYAGRTLMALRVRAPGDSTNAGTAFLDLTGPWSR